MTEATHTCSTCKHWSPKTSGAMANHLLCRCAVGPAWRYWAPQASCRRHSPAAAETVAERVTWIAKKSRAQVPAKVAAC